MSDLEALLTASIAMVRGERMPLPKRRIGGTDISKLMGLNPYGGPLDVFERIVLGKDVVMNERMERGQREEPRIRRIFVERSGAVLAPHPGIIQHPEHVFATVSPDDFADIGFGELTVDYKSVSRWSIHKWGEEGSDEIPEHYALQLHWAMAVTGKPAACLFAAFGEDITSTDAPPCFEIVDTRAYWLTRDRELEAVLLDVADRFWTEHILTGVPPEPTRKPKKTKSQPEVHQ